MTKYYRVKKDHPFWEVGAIISNEEDKKTYHAVEDIWDKIKMDKDSEGKDKKYVEYTMVVENASDFFERVYKSSTDKLMFKTAEQLKKVYNKFA